MALAAGQGIARITWSLTGRIKPLGAGFHFTASTAHSADDHAATIAAALVTGSTGTGPMAAAECIDAYEWETVDVSFNTGSGVFDGSAVLAVVGTNHNTPAPVNCCVLVRKRSGLGNRHGRGRMYLPPYFPGEQLIDGSGIIDSGTRATMSTHWNNFLGNMSGAVAPVVMCVGSGFTPVTSLEVESTIATQRKRLR